MIHLIKPSVIAVSVLLTPGDFSDYPTTKILMTLPGLWPWPNFTDLSNKLQINKVWKKCSWNKPGLWNKLLLKKEEISREVGNIKETIQKQFQKEINDIPSLQSTLWQKKKKVSGFHYLKNLILPPWVWKTIWSNDVDTGHSNCKRKEKSFNSENKVTI